MKKGIREREIQEGEFISYSFHILTNYYIIIYIAKCLTTLLPFAKLVTQYSFFRSFTKRLFYPSYVDIVSSHFVYVDLKSNKCNFLPGANQLH